MYVQTGYTLLKKKIDFSRKDIIQLIIDRGANMDIQDEVS